MTATKIEVQGELKLKVLPNGSWCELLEPLHITVLGAKFTIPAGFQTDFASVPKMFWSIIPPMGLYTIAAIAHDFLYWDKTYARKFADKVFKALMEFYKVAKIKIIVMYAAVRIGGGRSYKKRKSAKLTGLPENRVYEE